MKMAILKTFTVLWLMGMYIMLVWTFMVAYQSPQKAVRVAIDNYSEAGVEFVMLTAGLLAATIGTLYIVSDIRRDFEARSARRLKERYV